MTLIEVNNVSKVFQLQGPRVFLSARTLGSLLMGRKRRVEALKDISFKIEAGESVGIIGGNGSGKSTLLKIIAGVTVPTTGHVTVRGRVVSLLELGAGFHPLLTGRENIFLNGHILGMSHAEISRVYDQIVEFSGIGASIDNPVNTYSSGMFVRLAFAVAVHTDPDIFLVDEVLSVGDEEFQRRCRNRIRELKAKGKTIVFVSHDLGIVSALCNNVVLLQKGTMISRGTPAETIDYYLSTLGEEIQAGQMKARFYQGALTITFGEQTITQALHLHSQALIGQLWNFSQYMPWDDAESDGNCLRVTGTSRRLPFRQHWEIGAVREGVLSFKVWFEPLEPLEVDEYNISIGLKNDYKQWETPHESGQFAEFDPQNPEWSHMNRQYAPAEWARAYSETLPPVHLEVGSQIPFRMTLANTGYDQRTRVMQAMRVPERGQRLFFEKGRHLWFDGEIRISPSTPHVNREEGNDA